MLKADSYHHKAPSCPYRLIIRQRINRPFEHTGDEGRPRAQAQLPCPALVAASAVFQVCPCHVLGNRSFGDLDPELE